MGHFDRSSERSELDWIMTYSSDAQSLSVTSVSLGHDVMGDTTKLRRLDDPLRSTSWHSEGRKEGLRRAGRRAGGQVGKRVGGQVGGWASRWVGKWAVGWAGGWVGVCVWVSMGGSVREVWKTKTACVTQV